MAIIDLLDRGCRLNPDGVAFRAGERTWTYRQVVERSHHIAAALDAHASGARLHVGVLADNDPEGFITVLGAWRGDHVWVPLNAAYPIGELTALMARFQVQVLFFHARFRELLTDAFASGTVLVCLDEPEAPDGIDTWLKTAQGAVARDRTPDPEDLVAIMATGGTTGLPKGAMHTHRSLAAMVVHLMMGFHYEDSERPVNLAAAPLTHAAGLLALPTLARGGTVVVLPRAEPRAVLDAIERHAVTELFLPPTAIYRLLDHPKLDGADLSSLRYLLYGAAPITPDRLVDALRRFGSVLMTAYGQMEAPMSVTVLRPAEHFRGDEVDRRRLSSVGTPYPLAQVRILDPEGTELPAGERGEICVRGEQVMRGYFNNPAETSAVLVDGWLHTGDLGMIDEEGHLHLTGRRKELIISGGSNVYPADVEQVIAGLDGVREAAVVGLPDPDWGEAVTAFVELLPGCTLTGDDVIRWCRPRLGGIRTPKSVHIVPELPRSPVGKILKRELVATAKEGRR